MKRNTVLNRLLSMLPFYEQKSSLVKGIMGGFWSILKSIDEKINDYINQFFVDSATWGLPFFEKELGLSVNRGLNIEERRAIIKANYITEGKSSIQMISSAVSNLFMGKTIVTYNGDAIIHLIISAIGIGNLGSLDNLMNRIKPAHIDYTFDIVDNRGRANIVLYPVCITNEKITINADIT